MVLALALLALTAVLGSLAVRDLLAGTTDGGEGPAATGSGGSGAAVTPAAAISLGLPGRLRRAGKDGTVSARSVLVAKALAGGAGLMLGLMISPLAPGRLGPAVLAGFALAGFFTPDLLLERAARARHRRMIVSLPDALDLLAVSVATGKSLGAAFVELGSSARGPLAEELAATGEDMAWGSGQAAALEGLRNRVAGKEIASLCATLERSRKLGSPLADQMRRQSAGLRQDQRRAIEEEAARAAPKIQLVIALVLVPSVLLLIVAALVANADKLLGAGL
jgi:tight adherence protein C